MKFERLTDRDLLKKFPFNGIFKTKEALIVDTIDQIDKDKVSEIMFELLVYSIGKDKFEDVSRALKFNLIDKFCEQIPYHEGILIFQKMLGEKFYRDHLMHMGRVMLLSHAIASTLNLDKKIHMACILAGLFHDIGYPLYKAQETFSNILKALKRCYPFFQIEEKIIFKFLANEIEMKAIEEKICGKQGLKCNLIYLDEMERKEMGAISRLIALGKNKLSNHAVLSAFAFLDFWHLKELDKDTRQAVSIAAESIANHDYEVGGNFKYSENPSSVILILADELQDWGRPVGASNWMAVPNVKSFKINTEEINVTYDYSLSRKHSDYHSELFSPLLQLEAKQKNLSRIILDGNFPKLHLIYELPEYVTWNKDTIICYLKKISRFLHDFDVSRTRLVTDSFSQLKTWFSNLFEKVINIDNSFCLFFNKSTGEYLISDNERVVKNVIAYNVIAYTDDAGSLKWNVEINGIKKPIVVDILERYPFAVRTDVLITTATTYKIRTYETLLALERLMAIENGQWVERLVALCQLIPLVYWDAIKNGVDVISELDKNVIYFISALYRSNDPCYNFFHLKVQ